MKKTTLAMLIASITASSALVANTESDYVFQYASTKGLFKPLDLTPNFTENNSFKAESGTLTFRVKSGGSFGTIFGAANPNTSTTYLSFYSLPDLKNRQDTFGIEIRNGTNLIDNSLIRATVQRTGNYRTLTYTFDKDKNKIDIYIDGNLAKSHKVDSRFFNDIPSLQNAFLGETRRSTAGGYNTMRFSGDIFYADFDKRVLDADKVAKKHEYLKTYEIYSFSKREPLGALKTEAIDIFPNGHQGSNNYRIPSLLSTQNGVVIAAIDKRNQHPNDWGNIDTAIRRSFDNGKTWENDQVILDLPEQSYGSTNAAFLIDPSMLQDKRNGRVFMLLDMFPEMQGLFNFPDHGEGTGYKKIRGKNYRLLTDIQGNHYTVRENGIVYNESNLPTNYRVEITGTQNIGYKDLGNLYDGDTLVGNIFLNSNAPRGQKSQKAPLTAKKTSHLWLTYSDDDGATWSSPIDLTPQVKADWMKFLGTGPGTGLQLKNGDLIFPIYYTNNLNNHLSSQSTAVIISRDGGLTWERSESPMDRWAYTNDGTRELANNRITTESQLIELDNGDIKMFSRNRIGGGKVIISTSKDGGYTWQNSYQVDDILLDPYSQLSVIKYSKKINGKEIILFANPHATNRTNGKVWLGEVQDDGSIEWKYNTTITTGDYAYNSLAELPDGRIGLLYEKGNAGGIKYVSLNIQELVWHDNRIYRDSRDTENKEVSLDSPLEETFYKIGDGEMVKVGEGNNIAHLVIQEGTATLNQTANSEGQKQAYASVLVEQHGKVRLASNDQLPLNKLYLNNGTLDINGNSISVANSDELKKTAETENNSSIFGNIVNENATHPATLTYTVNGDNHIIGNLGNHNGELNVVYQPSAPNSHLRLHGNTILNVIDVKSGAIAYMPNTTHQANQLNIHSGSLFAIGTNTTTTIKQASLPTDTGLLVQVDKDQKNNLTINTSGAGDFIKNGSGLLKLSGNLTHSGWTVFNGGSVEFNGSQSNSKVQLSENTVLGGQATITGNTLLQTGSTLEPGLNQDSFTATVMKLANVVNEGAKVLLRVNNTDENTENWQRDQLLVSGNLTSPTSIPVDLQFLGDIQNANTDKNKNGKYDPDEGISLIQVAGDSETSKFTLGRKLDKNKQESDLFQYTLVSVDKPLSNVADSQFDGKKFYDYRLQTLLIDKEGNNPIPVVTTLDQKGNAVSESPNSISNEEIIALLIESKLAAEEAARLANEAKDQAENNARLANEAKDKAITDATLANQAKDKAINEATLANQAKDKALASLSLANKAKQVAEKSLADANLRLAELLKDKKATAQEIALAKAAKEKAESDLNNAKMLKEDAEASLVLANKAKEIAEMQSLNANQAKEKAEAELALANQAKELAVSHAISANKAKEDAEARLKQLLVDNKATKEEIAQAKQAKALADENARKANVLKQKAEELAYKADQARLVAENALKEKLAQEQQEREYRVALNAKVPSYLVSNLAILNHGETIRRQFMDNIWSDDKKGFYVNQQNGNSTYQSNLGFTNYGYDYKAKHSSTLFGGFVPVGEHSELHAAIGFGKQTVTPKAADGTSKTQYKSTSFLVGLHNKWDNWLLNASLGYHSHLGKVESGESKNAGRIDAKQLQLATEMGYEIPIGSLTLTPVVGLNYQQVKTTVTDSLNNWNVAVKPYNAFSQHIGTHLSWKNEIVRLSAGAFYEHNNAQPKAVTVNAGQQTSSFATGRQGDSIVLKVNSDFAITKQLSLGLRLEHKHPVSDAKLKQTQVGGKLEYQF